MTGDLEALAALERSYFFGALDADLAGFLGAEARTNKGRPTLSEGSTGKDVTDAQEMLASLGYNTPVSGSFGAQTELAVTLFQSQYDLPVTGKIDSATWSALDTATGTNKTAQTITDLTAIGTSIFSALTPKAQEPAAVLSPTQAEEKSGPNWLLIGGAVGGVVLVGGFVYLLTR